MVLDALEADGVAERQQRVIIGEVARAVQSEGLIGHAPVRAQQACGNIEVLWMIGECVELDERGALLPQIPLPHVAPQIQRRVDEHVERRHREVDAVAALRRAA